MKTVLLALDEPTISVALFTTAAIFFLLAVLLTRWVFQIPAMIKLQKQQTAYAAAQKRVIELMALKQGISTEEINKINEAVKTEFFS